MRKLLKTSILVFAFCFCAFAQTTEVSTCPPVSISTPSGGYMGRGEDVTLTANVNNINSVKLIYNWKLSDSIPIKGQGSPVMSFTAVEEMNFLNISATVKVLGLPVNCKNTVSESFQILFDPGVPMALDEYGKLPLREEKARLSVVALNLKKEPNSTAIFIIHFTKKDSYLQIKKRVVNITNFLTKSLDILEDKLKFFYSETDDYGRTIIYLAQPNVYPFWDGEKDLEKLRPQNKKSKTKNN